MRLIHNAGYLDRSHSLQSKLLKTHILQFWTAQIIDKAANNLLPNNIKTSLKVADQLLIT